MLNMVEEQEALKDFSDQQLIKEIQRPSGNIRPISVVGELNRRNTSRQRAAAAEAADTPTVAEEAVAAAGMPTSGVTQMAQAMAPKTSMTENTGIAAMMPKQPTKMAGGGVIKANTGLPTPVVLGGFKYNVYSDGRVVPDMEGRPTTPLDPNMTNDRNIITQAIAAAKNQTVIPDPPSDPYAPVVGTEIDTSAFTNQSLTNMVTDAIDASTVKEDPSYYQYIPPGLRSAADSIRNLSLESIFPDRGIMEGYSQKRDKLLSELENSDLTTEQRDALEMKLQTLPLGVIGQAIDDAAGDVVGMYQRLVVQPFYQGLSLAGAGIDSLAGTNLQDAALGVAAGVKSRGNKNILQGFVPNVEQAGQKAPLMTDAQQAANLEDLKTTPDADEKPKPEDDPALEELKRLQAIEAKATGSLMEFLKDLEKDKEKDAIMDLVRFGSILMKPTATIGEGVANAAIGTLDAKKERKKDYNKNKIAILGLSERIAAQKAAAARSNYSLGLQEQRLALAIDQQDRLLKKAQTDQLAQSFELLGGSDVYEELSRKEELTADEAQRLSQMRSILTKLMPSLANNTKTIEVADSA